MGDSAISPPKHPKYHPRPNRPLAAPGRLLAVPFLARVRSNRCEKVSRGATVRFRVSGIEGSCVAMVRGCYGCGGSKNSTASILKTGSRRPRPRVSWAKKP